MSAAIESTAARTDTGMQTTRKGRNHLLDFTVRLFREKPLGAIGGIIFMMLLVTGIFADAIAPYSYVEINPVDRLKPPSSEHLFGTDHLGRDMFSRIVYGARLSVIVGFSATAFSILISSFLGITSGFLGGKYDFIVQRFVDAWMIFPGLVVLIVFVSIFSPGTWQIIIILGLQYGIVGSRIVRGATITTKENMYVKAADSIGASTWRILLRHILPNIMAPIIVLSTLGLGNVILAEAALSFLGFGIQPPNPSWGRMLSQDGMDYMLLSPGLAVFPGIAISLAVFGFNMLGDALRDLLDPRLQGGK